MCVVSLDEYEYYGDTMRHWFLLKRWGPRKIVPQGMNLMKVNETHDNAVYEKIKVLHYFKFGAEGFIFFLLNLNFTYTRQAMSQFGINVIHVINFSNVQNVLRISVMYVMSRVRIFV